MNFDNDFDNYVDNYDELLSKDTNFFTKNTDYFSEYKIEIIKKRLKILSPQKILEPGCGIGRNLKELRKAYKNSIIVGTDISKQSVAYVNANINFVECFEEDFVDHKLNNFDLLLVSGVYHHLDTKNWDSFTDLCAKRLKKGGEMVIFEHNPFNLITRYIVSRCPYDKGVRLIRKKNLINCIKNHKLSVLNEGYCLFVPQKFNALKKYEYFFRWLPLGGQYFIHVKK